MLARGSEIAVGDLQKYWKILKNVSFIFFWYYTGIAGRLSEDELFKSRLVFIRQQLRRSSGGRLQ